MEEHLDRARFLCKLLCHNRCCLIREQEELDIVPVFWKEDD